jgi:hypothetical protein
MHCARRTASALAACASNELANGSGTAISAIWRPTANSTVDTILDKVILLLLQVDDEAIFGNFLPNME